MTNDKDLDLQLSADVQDLLEVRGKLRKHETTLKDLPKTSLAKQYDSLKELQEGRDLVKHLEKERLGLEYEIKTLKETKEKLEKDIIRTLGVRLVWVKVPVDGVNYAVGYRTEAWGGDHIVLLVEKWKDDMYQLRDIRDYD